MRCLFEKISSNNMLPSKISIILVSNSCILKKNACTIFMIFIKNIPLNTESLKKMNTSLLKIYNPKSEKVGTVWKTQIKKESSDF